MKKYLFTLLCMLLVLMLAACNIADLEFGGLAGEILNSDQQPDATIRDENGSLPSETIKNDNSTIPYEAYYVNVHSITISPENYDSDHSWDEAEFTAEYLLEKWKSGEATEQSMVEIMNQYGSDQGGGKLHSVYPEDWIEEVDSWCFDRNRQVGDVAIIENVYGYTIVYFSGAVEIDN